MTKPRFRRALFPFALLAATLCLAGSASAAELRLEGSTLVFRAAPGEANDMSVDPDIFAPGAVQFTDVYDPVLGPGLACDRSTAGGWYYLSCDASGVAAIRLEGSDGVDQLDVGDDVPFAGPISLDGGSGNDKLRGPLRDRPVDLQGGEGDDTVDGGGGADVVRGGPGNDRLDGRDGNDQVHGEDGDDNLSGGYVMSSDLLDGGNGNDEIDSDWYDANRPTNSVTVTLDGVADDGRPGEGDNVVNVETIKTRQAARLVAGGSAVVFDVTGTAAGSTTLIGSPAADRLRSFDYDDRIEGQAGDDSIEAGNGHDTIDPGPGRDSVIADAGPNSCNFLECRGVYGNDTILARDGEADSIDCGGGTDRVVADPVDTLANCETVEVSRPTGGGGGGSAKTCTVPKVKPGTTVAAARRKLAKANCKVAKKLRRVASRKVPKGRVVKLSAKAGKSTAKPVTISVAKRYQR